MADVQTAGEPPAPRQNGQTVKPSNGQTFKLTDPFGTAPSKPPFTQAVSTGVPWNNRNYTLGQLLDQTIARCGPQDALVYSDRGYRLTWYEFGEEVDRLARGLMSLGVQHGEKVALWATNVPHWIALMFATAKIGAILLPLNIHYKEAEIDFALKQSDTENIFVINGYRDCDYVQTLYKLIPELQEQPRGELHCKRYPHLRRVMFLGPEKHRGMYSLNEVLALSVETSMQAYLARQAEVKPDDVVNMQYTSGTTGFPKGVQLTHYNIGNDGFWIGACQNFSARDRVCIPVPLFHCFGCVLGVMSCVNHGATMVVLEKYDALNVMASVQAEKCTAVYGVPTMYIAMLDHPLFKKFDFSSLRTGIMSGSTCPIRRMQQCIDEMNMGEVTNPYGLTESGPVMTMTRYFETSIERKCTTIGQALPGIEVAIIEPETGRRHEIAVRSGLAAFVLRRVHNHLEQTANPKAIENEIHIVNRSARRNGQFHSTFAGVAEQIAQAVRQLEMRRVEFAIEGFLFPGQCSAFIGWNRPVEDAVHVVRTRRAHPFQNLPLGYLATVANGERAPCLHMPRAVVHERAVHVEYVRLCHLRFQMPMLSCAILYCHISSLPQEKTGATGAPMMR